MSKTSPIIEIKEEYVWLRIGDAGDYEKFDSVWDAAIEVAAIVDDKDASIQFRRSGVYIYPGFSGQNYISLYWGDDEANHIRDLEETEKQDFIESYNGNVLSSKRLL